MNKSHLLPEFTQPVRNNLGYIVCHENLNCQDVIEKIIDSTSLAQFCDMIGEVCDAKGAHLEHNWQDRSAARAWKKNAKKFFNLSKETNNV